MGLEAFDSDGPRTYKKGGRRDPNSEGQDVLYSDREYDGVIHVPTSIEVPELARELNLKPIQVDQVNTDLGGGNGFRFFALKGKRQATTYEAMVKKDMLDNRDKDGIKELVDILIKKAKQSGFNATSSTNEQTVEDNSGIAAFME